jgi:hypothetical protein
MKTLNDVVFARARKKKRIVLGEGRKRRIKIKSGIVDTPN